MASYAQALTAGKCGGHCAIRIDRQRFIDGVGSHRAEVTRPIGSVPSADGSANASRLMAALHVRVVPWRILPLTEGTASA